MKDNQKLRALALLAAIVAVIALGTLAYPKLSQRAQQESGAQTQGLPAVPVADEQGEAGDKPASESANSEETDASQETDGLDGTGAGKETAASEKTDAAPKTDSPEESDATSASKQESGSQGEVAGPMFKRMATDFTVYDVEGNALRLSDYRGKPVVVNFFASWCGPCRIELPYFEAAYQTYGEQIEFLMVDLNGYGNDVAEDALAMIEEGGYTFPIRFDSDGEAALFYSVRSIPTTLLVAPDGELLGTQVGSMSEAMLAQVIATLLGTI